MNLPNLFPQLGWLLLFLPLAGIAVSFSFRQSKWVLLVWLPTVSLLFYLGLWTIWKILGYGHVRGPDAIGIGIVVPILLGLLAIVSFGLLLCYWVRPKRNAWQPPTVAVAVTVCVAIAILSSSRFGGAITGKVGQVTFVLTDCDGKPLSNLDARLVTYDDGIGVAGVQLRSDSSGKFSVWLRKRQSEEIEIHAPIPPSGILSGMPTFWNIHLNYATNQDDVIEVRHSWQRSLGGKTFNEAFCEYVHATGVVLVPVVVPPHSGFYVPALRERIKTAITNFPASSNSSPNLGYVCRNIEAIELIPWLVDKYERGPTQRASIVEGMKQIGGILDEMARASQEVSRRYGHPREFGLKYMNGELAFESASLCAWAGDPQTDRTQGLRKAEAKISEHAQILSDFVLSHIGTAPELVGILAEMSQTARPVLPKLIEYVQANPPHSMRDVYGPSSAIWRIAPDKQRRELLLPLFNSGDPMLVLLAVEAFGNETTAESEAMILDRLKTSAPKLNDSASIARAQMYAKMFEARLAARHN